MGKKPELLAPCGSFDALRAAVNAGADAVYFGGKAFSARMNARNFDRDEIVKAVAHCHQNGVRAYAALNTQITDKELKQAAEDAAFLYQADVDALIVSDLGLAALVADAAPDLALHASTQAAGHNAAAASVLAGLGFRRMVCARELCAKDVRALCAAAPIEIEMFVHGALCVSQSGGCLMSAVIGGRSGNRGACAQPCRLPYNGGYPLSLKDLCLAGHMREVLASGVASLKIEGRMKSAAYVDGVISIYRRLIDEGRDATEKEMERLRRLFSRSGFTDGYFTGRPGPAMLGVRTAEDKNRSAALPARKSGGAVRPALTPPKRGPVQFAVPESGRSPAPLTLRSARFYRADAIPQNARDYFDIIYLPLSQYTKEANGVLLPPVIPESQTERVRRQLAAARQAGAAHVLVSNLGQLPLCRAFDFQIHIDYRLNVFNSPAVLYFSQFGDVLLSPELTLPQLRDIRGSKAAVVYGRLPLMTIERPMEEKELRDRRGVRFPLIKEGGRTLLLNSVPLYMADRQADLRAAGLTNQHFIFTIESRRQAAQIIEQYKAGSPPAPGVAVTRIKTKSQGKAK